MLATNMIEIKFQQQHQSTLATIKRDNCNILNIRWHRKLFMEHPKKCTETFRNRYCNYQKGTVATSRTKNSFLENTKKCAEILRKRYCNNKKGPLQHPEQRIYFWNIQRNILKHKDKMIATNYLLATHELGFMRKQMKRDGVKVIGCL